MKKALLFISILLFSTLCALAYETVIIKFPDGELWNRAYYKKYRNEAILQYTPKGQTTNDWVRSIVVHSYEYSNLPINTFISANAARMRKVNPTGQYKTLKLKNEDAIIGRCTDDYKNVKAQCEFFRAAKAHGGIVTIHYMNRNKDDFMNNYEQWYDIIRKAVFYNSYWRDERTFDKAIYFEL